MLGLGRGLLGGGCRVFGEGRECLLGGGGRVDVELKGGFMDCIVGASTTFSVL